MVLRAIPAGNPAEIRRLVQPVYDSYMSGRRLRVGMWFDGLEDVVAANTLEARSEGYDAFAEKWPNKSQRLMRGMAREIVFHQVCLDHHREWSAPLLEGIDKATEGVEVKTPVAYMSGLGRNACITTLLRRGIKQEVVAPLDTAYVSLIALGFNRQGVDMPLVVDPDFGLGTLSSPTPELLDTQTGSAELASGAWESFGNMLEAFEAAKRPAA